MKKCTFLLVLFLATIAPAVLGQSIDIYPTNWWTGMKMNKLQLLLRSTSQSFEGKQLTTRYPGISVLKTHRFENPRYLAIDIVIAPGTKPGMVPFQLTGQGAPVTLQWPLQDQRKGKGTSYAQGITSADFVNLMLTDRFSNGDPSN